MISITGRWNIRVAQRKRGYVEKSVTLENHRIEQRNRRKDEMSLSAIIDDTGNENFEDKIPKEEENCNIPDLETLVRTCMQIQLTKTLDAICYVLVENPN